MHFNSSLTTDEKLFNAIKNGDETAVTNIISVTPTLIYKRGKNGWTHFHTAVENNNPKLVDLFLKTIEMMNTKIDIQLVGLKKLKSELFSSREFELNGPIQSIEKLKINVHQLIASNEENGLSLMDLALLCRSYEIITLFRKHVPCEIGYLKKAIKSNDKKLFDCLIQSDHELNLEDTKQRTIAHYIVRNLYLDIDKINFFSPLIGKIDLNKPDHYGATPLHYLYGFEKYRISNYCEQNEIEEKSQTLIEYLESKGANPEILDNLGYSVADWRNAGGNPIKEIGSEKKLQKKTSSLKKLIKLLSKISINE